MHSELNLLQGLDCVLDDVSIIIWNLLLLRDRALWNRLENGAVRWAHAQKGLVKTLQHVEGMTYHNYRLSCMHHTYVSTEQHALQRT